MQQPQNKPFGKIRSFLWPIHRYELKKLIPMFTLFFLITFVYNLLRTMKIAIIVTAKGSGAEAISFLKLFGVLPGAIILTYIFTKLISRFTREQVFYTMLGGFLTYFAVFMLLLYPNHASLQLDVLADYLQHNILVKPGFSGMIAVIRHFNLSLFYVLTEMWSSVVLSTLFWGFANEVTTIDEAKRFYAIFALGANSSSVFCGLFAQYIRKIPYNPILPFDPTNQWVFYHLSVVLLIGMIIITLFYWLNRSVFNIENLQSVEIPKKANKISLAECIKYLIDSRYLRYIVTIVICYNIVYNLADTMWTNQVKQLYQNSKDVNMYMSQVGLVTGIFAVIFTFVISGNVIRNYGWTVAALITPLIWLITSFGVFSRLFWQHPWFFEIFSNLITNPANFFLLISSLQICLGRACKYSVFDETKEISFIPLSQSNQRKAKAVVDGIASRFGKSGGSLIYIGLFMYLHNIQNATPWVAVIMFIGIILWIYAVLGLGKMTDKFVINDHMNVMNLDNNLRKNVDKEDIVRCEQPTAL